MTVDVDALVEQLDARCAESGERWELYRLHPDVGGWRAHAHDQHASPGQDPAAVSARGSTIGEALAGLLARRRLPVVPRQPAVAAGRMDVVKDGSEWAVREDGQWITRSRTKRDALAFVGRYEEGVRARYEAWVDEWAALVNAGVEGRDFYWKK